MDEDDPEMQKRLDAVKAQLDLRSREERERDGELPSTIARKERLRAAAETMRKEREARAGQEPVELPDWLDAALLTMDKATLAQTDRYWNQIVAALAPEGCLAGARRVLDEAVNKDDPYAVVTDLKFQSDFDEALTAVVMNETLNREDRMLAAIANHLWWDRQGDSIVAAVLDSIDGYPERAPSLDEAMALAATGDYPFLYTAEILALKAALIDAPGTTVDDKVAAACARFSRRKTREIRHRLREHWWRELDGGGTKDEGYATIANAVVPEANARIFLYFSLALQRPMLRSFEDPELVMRCLDGAGDRESLDEYARELEANECADEALQVRKWIARGMN